LSLPPLATRSISSGRIVSLSLASARPPTPQHCGGCLGLGSRSVTSWPFPIFAASARKNPKICVGETTLEDESGPAWTNTVPDRPLVCAQTGDGNRHSDRPTPDAPVVNRLRDLVRQHARCKTRQSSGRTQPSFGRSKSAGSTNRDRQILVSQNCLRRDRMNRTRRPMADTTRSTHGPAASRHLNGDRPFSPVGVAHQPARRGSIKAPGPRSPRGRGAAADKLSSSAAGRGKARTGPMRAVG